jgi:hypothetical protein
VQTQAHDAVSKLLDGCKDRYRDGHPGTYVKMKEALYEVQDKIDSDPTLAGVIMRAEGAVQRRTTPSTPYNFKTHVTTILRHSQIQINFDWPS